MGVDYRRQRDINSGKIHNNILCPYCSNDSGIPKDLPTNVQCHTPGWRCKTCHKIIVFPVSEGPW